MIAAILSVQVGSMVTDGDSSPADSLRRKWTTGFYKVLVSRRWPHRTLTK